VNSREANRCRTGRSGGGDLLGGSHERRLTVHLKVAEKTLTSTLELNSNGLAYVVNDNLGDSCQRKS
jgi:hypothetical protein